MRRVIASRVVPEERPGWWTARLARLISNAAINKTVQPTCAAAAPFSRPAAHHARPRWTGRRPASYNDGMIHNVDAIYDQGVFRPVAPLTLPNGTPVHLRVETQSQVDTVEGKTDEGEIPTLLERLKDFVGTVHDLPPDASVNLDHYLYGTPKRQ